MNWWVIVVETCLKSLHGCLYVDDVWIGVVVCEVWMRMRKIKGFGGNWTRWWIWGELVLWFKVCCGFECLFMFLN